MTVHQKNRCKILILDDDEDLRAFCRLILVEGGFDVIEAATFTSFKSTMKDDIDLVVLDVVLGGEFSGIDALKYLRCHFPLCPAIMISAYADKNNAIDALKQGAVDYIEKPLSHFELIYTVQHWIDYNRLKDNDLRIQDYKSAHKAIQETSDRLNAIISTAGEAIVCVNSSRQIVLFNDAAEALLGYTQDEILGKLLDILIPENICPFHQQHEEGFAREQVTFRRMAKRRPVFAKTKSGLLIPTRISVSKLNHNNEVFFTAVLQEYTELISVEQQLRDERRTLHELIETTPYGVVECDDCGRINSCNTVFHQVLGQKEKNVLHKYIWDFIFLTSAMSFQEHYNSLMHAESTPKPIEAIMNIKGGKTHEIRLDWSYKRDELGNTTGIVGVITDLASIKESEALLTASEERFLLAIAASNDGIWDWDLKTNSLYLSARWLEMLGYQIGELPTTFSTWKRLLHHSERKRVSALIKDFVEGKVGVFSEEIRMRHRNGHDIFIFSRAKALRDHKGVATRIVGTHEDITEKIKARIILKESEQHLNSAQSLAHVGSWSLDFKSETVPSKVPFDTPVSWSNEMYHILGLSKEHYIPSVSSFTELVHPEDLPNLLSWIDKCLKGSDQAETEFRFIRPDGIICHLYGKGNITSNKQGTPLRLSGVIQDITLSKQQQLLLKESHKWFETIFNYSSDGLFIQALNGMLINVSQTACDRLGYSKEEMLTMMPADLEHHDQALNNPQRLAAVIKDRKNIYETEYYTRDGTLMPVEINARVVDINGEPVILSVIRDLSERRQAQKAIQEKKTQEKSLAEKEMLLREIHHRVKNNMQVVTSLLALEARSCQGDKMAEILIETQNRIRSMALVHERLYRSDDLMNIDFGEYMGTLIRELASSVGAQKRGVSLQFDLGHVLMEIDKAIPCGLLINELVTNAFKHAFPEEQSGKISAHLSMNDAKLVSIVISDDGVGFIHECWEQNSTLGLRMVKALSEQLLGKIDLTVKNGASFRVVFPVKSGVDFNC